MLKRDSYLFYEAGQAVAAAHLGLTIRFISANPALRASEIVVPRANPKARLILWLAGMAAEKKGVGKSDPLRRTRNRQRVRAQFEALIESLTGTPARRQAEARSLLNQSQDRANAICTGLYEAIIKLVERLRVSSEVSGEEVVALVAWAKSHRRTPLDMDADDIAPL